VKKKLKFSKRDRLLTRHDFSAVFDAAHTSNGSQRAIFHREPYIIYRKSSETPRLGLSVARRVIRKATERNRIKRCVREFFRAHKEVLLGDYVVRVVNRPASDEYITLTKPLELLLQLEKNKKTSKS
jgi:ribonuclease P protein component